MHERTSYWSKSFWLTSLSSLFFYFGFQMMIPTLPVYIVQQGGDHVLAGAITGIITLAAVLARPYTGLLLATKNKRTIAWTGIVLAAIAALFFTFSGAIWWMILSSIILGLGWGIMTVTLGTIVADLIPANLQGSGIGTYVLFSLFSAAGGPIVGQWILSSFGTVSLFLVAMVLFLIPFLLIAMIKVANSTTLIQPDNKPKIIENLYDRSALFPAFLQMLFTISYGGILSFVNLFGKDLGYEQLGWYFLLTNAVAIAMRSFTGRIFDRKGPSFLLIPGIIMGILSLVTLSFSTGTLGIAISAILYGGAFGCISPTIMAWTVQRARPEKRGAANSTYLIGADMGIAVGSIGLGFVVKMTNYADMFCLTALILVLFLVIYIPSLLRRRKNA